MTNETDDSDDETEGSAASTPADDGAGAGSPAYAQALDELEDLLDELEGADIDVDRLAERVARGAELIRFCRARLDVVTADVDAVVTELITVEALPEGTD